MKILIKGLLLVLLISFAFCAENDKNLKTEKNNKMKSEKMNTVEGNKYEINLQMQTDAQMMKEKKVGVS
jgi:hypothetical protein